MYVYTDDDLTRINRDYLGPKGRRLPWVATYRNYGVALGVLVGMFALFMAVGIPFNQWTLLLYGFSSTLVITWFNRRLNRDVSIWAMAKAGWQEVTVPRAPRPVSKAHTVRLQIKRWDYDAEPPARWWQRRSTKTKTDLAANSQPAPITPASRRATRRTDR